MTALIERLRRYKRDRSGYAEYCHQAADEIEHLTLDLHTERATVAALRAEVASLRKSAALRVQFHAAELADVTAEREQLEDGYNRGYQAAMQRQATEVDALIAQWPKAKPKGKK